MASGHEAMSRRLRLQISVWRRRAMRCWSKSHWIFGNHLSVNPPLARRVNYDDLPSERSSSDVAFSSAAARSNSPACSNKRALLSEPDDSDDSEQSSMTARSHASKVDLLIIVFHWADQDRTEFDVSYIPVVHSVHPV